MTRINCIPAELQLDQHLQASVREGLRPVHDVFEGKKMDKAPDFYKLGEGHVLFHRKHAIWTLKVWQDAMQEYRKRGETGFGDWHVDGYQERLQRYPVLDYEPTVEDYRHNLARIIHRWRVNPKYYTFCNRDVKTLADFRSYVSMVEESLRLRGV